MSNLTNWFHKNEHLCPSAEIQLLEDFVGGSKIESRPAAISLTKNIKMKEKPNDELYDIVETLVDLGVHSFDTAIQNKVVELASAIRTIRKYSLNRGNEISLCDDLGEIDQIIGDWWSCKYLRSSFDLLMDTNSNTTLYLYSS